MRWSISYLLYSSARNRRSSASELGRFAEATVAQVEAWLLARELRDTEREVWAIGNFGALCAGMGQWNIAILYFERARELAEEHGFADLEFQSRTNLAHCAVQLREPAAGLRALSQFCVDAPQDQSEHSLLPLMRHNNLARLYLLVGDYEHGESPCGGICSFRQGCTLRENDTIT